MGANTFHTFADLHLSKIQRFLTHQEKSEKRSKEHKVLNKQSRGTLRGTINQLYPSLCKVFRSFSPVYFPVRVSFPLSLSTSPASPSQASLTTPHILSLSGPELPLCCQAHNTIPWSHQPPTHPNMPYYLIMPQHPQHNSTYLNCLNILNMHTPKYLDHTNPTYRFIGTIIRQLPKCPSLSKSR